MNKTSADVNGLFDSLAEISCGPDLDGPESQNNILFCDYANEYIEIMSQIDKLRKKTRLRIGFNKS